jgi:uncharacterized membrane protein
MRALFQLIGIHGDGAIARVQNWSLYPGASVPTWLLVLLGVVGLAAAVLNFLPQNTMPLRNRFLLAFLRLAGFALALLLLVQLELRIALEWKLPPRVALLADASQSMDLQDAGGHTRREAAQEFAGGLVRGLGDRVSLSRYAFAWHLEPGDGAKAMAGATGLARALGETLRLEDNLDAVILLTDGNDTGGDRGTLVAPLLASRGVPVYPVVFGRPEPPARAEVRIASAAPYVRLGDETVVGAVLTSSGLEEQVVRVSLFDKAQAEPLAVKEDIRLGKTPVPVRFVVKPNRAGEHLYRIVLDGVKGGTTAHRLAAEHRLDVVDARIRVLYIDIPRDERKILGHWLARDPVVDLATLTMLPKGGWYGQGALRHKDIGDGLPGQESDLYQYDVLILGDIPRSYFRQGGDLAETKLRWLCEFVARRGGGLITLGGYASYAAGGYQESPLAAILPFDIGITGDPQVAKEFAVAPTAIGQVHPLMVLEPEADANREAWFDLPTLEGCNRVGAIKPGASLLAVRQLPEGAMPVIAIQDAGKGKVLSLTADTTWRWELMREAEAPDYFRRFWGNSVRYLAPDPRRQPGRPDIQRARTDPAVGETLTLSTRLMDKLYQPVRAADLVITVTSPSGVTVAHYPRDSRSRPGLYEYEVPLTEPGDWSVTASNGTQVTVSTFHAGESQEELDDPRARPERMAELAAATGGRAFSPEESKALEEAVRARTRTVTRTHVVALWNLPLTLFLFFTLVCVDCLVRKRRGMA